MCLLGSISICVLKCLKIYILFLQLKAQIGIEIIKNNKLMGQII